jgi:hypothetical protein
MGGSDRRVEQREVDRFGLVDCRRRDRPTLAECAACSDLVGAVVDEDEHVVAVRCRVPRRHAPGEEPRRGSAR